VPNFFFSFREMPANLVSGWRIGRPPRTKSPGAPPPPPLAAGSLAEFLLARRWSSPGHGSPTNRNRKPKINICGPPDTALSRPTESPAEAGAGFFFSGAKPPRWAPLGRKSALAKNLHPNALMTTETGYLLPEGRAIFLFFAVVGGPAADAIFFPQFHFQIYISKIIFQISIFQNFFSNSNFFFSNFTKIQSKPPLWPAP